jgi:tetratricopeptide (TPR) repeat protein
MRLNGVGRFLTAAAFVFATGTLATAQTLPNDPVAEGYRQLYSGDKAGAVKHFTTLLAAHPDDLPRRFGLLMAERRRLDADAALRPTFERRLDALVDLADTRYGRTAQDSEALFYAAQAHMMRAEYRVNYDKGMWGAARDGAKAKGYIDTFIKQHPETGDAYYVRGLYDYYVDIAPTLVHMLRILLFLPAGNRVEGLRELERAASRGVLFGPAAAHELIDIYTQFEGRGADALAMGHRLEQQFPTNDDMALTVAGLYAGPLFEDRAQAAAAYRRIIDRHRADQSPEGAGVLFNAMLALAGVRLDQWQIDAALAILTPVVDAPPKTPDWVLPQFLLRRGNYRMLLNDPAAADDAKRVLADPALAKWHAGATTLLKRLEERQTTGEAVVYAALIPGNRLSVEGKWTEARQAYETVRAGHPQDSWVRFRLAWLDFLRDRADLALNTFSALAAAGHVVSDAIKANALLYLGRAYDLAGRRDDARKTYQKIVDDYATQGRVVAAARSGLLTPYQRPVTAHSGG